MDLNTLINSSRPFEVVDRIPHGSEFTEGDLGVKFNQEILVFKCCETGEQFYYTTGIMRLSLDGEVCEGNITFCQSKLEDYLARQRTSIEFADSLKAMLGPKTDPIPRAVRA